MAMKDSKGRFIKGHPQSNSGKSLFKKNTIPWNKGTKGIMKPNSGSFREGEHRSQKTEFKKGIVPWIKGKTHSDKTKRKMGLIHKGQKAWNKGITKQLLTKNCLICGKEFKSYISEKAKFCSKKCNGLYYSGENNPRYTGFIHRKYKIRVIDWLILRKLVLERDDYTCQECGTKDGLLDVHHIIPFRISQDNSISNLITLCRGCHMITEHKIIQKLRNGVALK